MNGYNNQSPMTSPGDKFALGKKWFWVGMVMGLNIFAGLIFGIALVIEKDHRREGLIIITWTIIWALIGYLWLGPYLRTSGLLPKFQIVR